MTIASSAAINLRVFSLSFFFFFFLSFFLFFFFCSSRLFLLVRSNVITLHLPFSLSTLKQHLLRLVDDIELWSNALRCCDRTIWRWKLSGRENIRMQNRCFSCYFIRVRKLVSHTEGKLAVRVFGERMLWKVLGPKRETLTADWIKQHALYICRKVWDLIHATDNRNEGLS